MARISFTQIVDSRFIKNYGIFLENDGIIGKEDSDKLKLELENRVIKIKDKLNNILMKKKDEITKKGKDSEQVFLNVGKSEIRKLYFSDKNEDSIQYRIDMYVETSRHITRKDIMFSVNEVCPVPYDNQPYRNATKSFIEEIDNLANKKDLVINKAEVSEQNIINQ